MLFVGCFGMAMIFMATIKVLFNLFFFEIWNIMGRRSINIVVINLNFLGSIMNCIMKFIVMLAMM